MRKMSECFILLRETGNLMNLRDERCLDLGAKTDREGEDETIEGAAAEEVRVSMAVNEALQIFIDFDVCNL